MRHPHRNALLAAVAAATFGLAPAAFAQAVQQERPQEFAPEDVEGFNTGGISVSASVDVTTKYFFRGILQEDQGVIVQPDLSVGFDIADTDDVSVGGYVGIWNSFHSEHTGDDGGSGPDMWYEADLYAGVDFEFSDFAVGVVYTAYTSPNGAFDTVQEVGVTFGYSGTAEISDAVNFNYDFGAGVYFELDNAADGVDEGIYGEIGITPGFGVEVADQEVAIGIPIVVGFSIDDYYESVDSTGDVDDDFLGFVQVGVTAGLPLAFIPEKYGDWEASAGVHALFLTGEDSTEAINNDDDFELIGTVGISMSY
jgi:hypothetical protein